MATASTVSAQPSKRLPGRRFDHVFFTSMIVLMAGTILLGFARTYFLAGVFHAPLASRILHIHGAVFSFWMLLVLAQTTLVSVHRVDIHRTLGLAGFGLSGLIVVTGVLATADMLARDASVHSRPNALAFSIVPLTAMLLFAIFIGLAYRARANSSVHKRLILLAMVDMMVAGIARWPFPFVLHNIGRAALISCGFIVMLVAYDLWSTHKIPRVTLWGCALIIVVQQSREMIGTTKLWLDFARWLQSWGI